MILDHKGHAVTFAEGGSPSGGDGPMLREIASARGEDVAGAYAGELQPYEDAILAGTRAGMQGYKRVKMDPQVKSVLQQRRDAVIERPWEVKAGGTSAEDEAAADFMREQLQRIKWDDTSTKMLWGMYYGYAVAELLLARDGRHVVLDELRVRDRERFRFDRDFRLRLVGPADMEGEVMPDRKFWYFTTGGDHDDDPYGLGLAHYLFWPVYFKRQGLRFRLIYLEKYGHPTPIGKFPPGTKKGERNRLLQALSAMVTDQGVILPEGMDVEKFEASRGASESGYQKLHEDMNAAIAKVTLSQTMTTDEGSSRAQSETHADVRDAVVKSDSRLVDESFTEHPARWLTEWNYPGAEPPIVSRKLTDDEDLTAVAERNVAISKTGYLPTPEKVTEQFGPGYERRDAPGGEAPGGDAPGGDAPGGDAPGGDAPGGDAPGSAEFSEEEAEDARAGYTGRVTEEADAEVARWGEQARALLGECSSLAEFSERLVELYPEIEGGQIADVLGDAMGAAKMAGRYEAQRYEAQRYEAQRYEAQRYEAQPDAPAAAEE